MTKTHAYDVIVIGYGPIGKMVSALLGQKGWNVGVFERYDRPYGLPRAVKYDHEITRLLQKICPVEDIKSEEVAWDLLKSWGIHPGNAKMERHAVYTFKAKWVDQWRKNRLFLAGDAAHLTPPFMGQGMSSGIRDAANLAWKMDLLLKGVTNDSILDTYTEERKPHMEKLIEAAIYLGKIICTTDVERAKQRDEQFLSGNFPPFPAFPTLTEGVFDRSGSEKEVGLTGHLSPQGMVEHNGQSGLFDNVVGQGWVLMGWNHDPKELLSEQQIQVLEEIGAVFAKVVPPGQPEADAVIDTEGAYQAFFRTNGIEVALFRQDFYIYGVREQKEELPTLIEGLSAQLTQQTNMANAR